VKNRKKAEKTFASVSSVVFVPFTLHPPSTEGSVRRVQGEERRVKGEGLRVKG
jgi:hypothetical protein